MVLRAGSTGGHGVQRNKDGVPIWSGESSLFEEYVEACLLYEQTVVKEKRYLCGPRVAAKLQRPARRVLIGRSADWLSQEGGVRKLIAALRSERGQPKVPEMSELRMLRSTSTAREGTVARAWGTSSSERLRPTREHSSPWPGIKESQDLRTCEKRTAQCNVHEEVHEQPGR